MKPRKKSLITAATVAAAMLLCVTVYATGAFQMFAFPGGEGSFVTMRTTDPDMTREDAEALVGDGMNIPADGEAVQAATPDVVEYDTVEEAEQALSVPVVRPGAMPELELFSVSGQILDFDRDYQSRTVWVNYGDIDSKLVGITVTRQIIAAGADVTAYTQMEIDPGSAGSYRTKAGVEYALFSESDETGERTARIAVAQTGEYEYALVMVGFDQEEQHALLDSVDLSAYR